MLHTPEQVAAAWKANDERNRKTYQDKISKLRLKWKKTGDIIWPWLWYDPETGWQKRMIESPEDYYPNEAKRIEFLLKVQFEEIDSKRPDWVNYW
jgi:hypothetical protein